MRPDDQWWRDAVFYQIYPRSFAATNSPSGVGNLRGVISRLPYIADLGADAIWLSPIFVSPQKDHGYDVADYYDIDPLFGTLADFDELLEKAHELELRVTLDLVPNHTSDQHEWFQAATAAGPDSPERSRYLFRNGRGPAGDEQPTDVVSSFGGPAWTRITEPDGSPGQWYFHLFAGEQPDLNWENPEVLAEFERVWRFWLDRGVDGFRVDVADHLTKDISRTDKPEGNHLLEHEPDARTHEVWRRFREVLNEYSPPRTAVGEIWAAGDDQALYGRPDEFPLMFNFRFLKAGWDPTELRAAIDEALLRRGSSGATPVWVTDNHDMVRSATRLADDPQVGLARSRALSLLMLCLPGTVYLYQGQELGLPNVDDLPDEVLQDPIWERSGHTDRGRDGCRVPLPWSADGSSLGFVDDPAVTPWLPQPASYAELAADRQRQQPDSTLHFFQALLRLRSNSSALRQGSLVWLPAQPGVLHLERQHGVDRMEVVVNGSDEPVELPSGTVLISSDPVAGERTLLPNTACCLVRD
jgi:alpha-glucosidase